MYPRQVTRRGRGIDASIARDLIQLFHRQAKVAQPVLVKVRGVESSQFTPIAPSGAPRARGVLSKPSGTISLAARDSVPKAVLRPSS